LKLLPGISALLVSGIIRVEAILFKNSFFMGTVGAGWEGGGNMFCSYLLAPRCLRW